MVGHTVSNQQWCLSSKFSTTAVQVFEYRDGSEGVGDSEDRGLRLKARGGQRFLLVSARRTGAGHLAGIVLTLPDTELGEPLGITRLGRVVTPLPPWLPSLYSPSSLAARAVKELAKLPELSRQLPALPSEVPD